MIKRKKTSKQDIKGTPDRASSVSLSPSPSQTSLDRTTKKKVTLSTEESGQLVSALAFKVLPQDVSKQLLEMDVDDMQRRLGEFFTLTSSDTDLREAATLDYYTSAVWWAKEQNFTDQQMSGFFTAVHTLLENIKEKQLKLVENITELKKMMVGIGAELTGGLQSGGMEFFDVVQGQAVSKYIFKSLFQHYRLFEFMFQEAQEEEIIGTELDVEVAKAAALPFPPPLDEGIEEDKFEAFVKTPPPSPTPEPGQEVSEEGAVAEVAKAQASAIDLDADVFTKLSPQDVKEVVESIAVDMLGNLQNEIAVKLREKENAILTRINKIHLVAEN